MRRLDFTRRIGLVGWFSIALCVTIAAALSVLWLLLADFQGSLPKNHAERILAAYRSTDVKTIGEICVNLPEVLEDPQLFASYYKDNTNLDELYFYSGSSSDPAELCYEFASGNDSVATLTLRQTENKSRFGFPLYDIVKLEGHPLTTYSITAPADMLLFADGKLLSEQYRTDEATADNSFASIDAGPFGTKSYEITDFFYIDRLDAIGMDNCRCITEWSDDRRTATVVKQMTEQEQQQIVDFATAFSEAYSVFATKRNGSRTPVLQMLYPKTTFYNALSLYSNDWGEYYTVDRYDNRVIDRLVRYSPTEFSCDISFNYVIKPTKGVEKTYPYSMTYYITSRGGQLRLVDMQARTS